MKILNKISEYRKDKDKYISKILNLKSNYNIKFNDNLLTFYNKDKKILAGDYHFFGIYQLDTKLWIWASSIPGINKQTIKFINKIKLSDHLFESDNNEKINFYYQFLTQDVIMITDERLLDWINELLIYLSNDIYFFNPKNSLNNIQFVTLSNIKEKYL